MSTRRPVAVALIACALLAGCKLTNRDGVDCTTQPGFTTGQQSVCVEPPPEQFDPMGK